MNILITSTGRRVALMKAFAQELSEVTPAGKVFAADMFPHLSPACSLADKAFTVPAVRDSMYIKKLLDICKANDIRLIIPTIDTELPILAANRDLLRENNIIPVVSESGLINIGSDKRKTHDFFRSRDISVAREYTKDSLTYPFFVKPVSGSSSKDLYLIKDETYLFSHVLDNNDFMCLEYLDPSAHDEFTVDCYYSLNGVLKCAVPRLRLETRGGEISKGRTVRNFLEGFIFDRLGFIDGAMGCLTWQFFVRKSDQEVIGIEVNPRFGGGFPLSYRAGANYPSWIIQEYLMNREIPVFREWQANVLMLRYDEDLFFAED